MTSNQKSYIIHNRIYDTYILNTPSFHQIRYELIVLWNMETRISSEQFAINYNIKTIEMSICEWLQNM